MDINLKIRQARKQASLSQQQLSQVIGVSDKAVSAYEVGRSTPPLKVLRKISLATKQSLTYFLDNHSQASPDQILAKLDAVEKELQQLRKLLHSKGL